MNIKALLIEKERMRYISGDTEMATFLSDVLDYVIEMEEKINKKDAELEDEKDRICDSLMKLHEKSKHNHNYFHWLANELRDGRL